MEIKKSNERSVTINETKFDAEGSCIYFPLYITPNCEESVAEINLQLKKVGLELRKPITTNYNQVVSQYLIIVTSELESERREKEKIFNQKKQTYSDIIKVIFSLICAVILLLYLLNQTIWKTY